MSNNPFVKIRLQPNYARGHLLQWWLDPAFTGKAPYQFIVTAYQDNGMQEAIFSKKLGEATFFLDDTRIRQNFSDSYIYTVSLVTADGQVFNSDPILIDTNSPDRHKYLLAAEMLRKEYLSLNYIGLAGWLLKRKYYAPAALAEVDLVTGEPIIDTSSGSYGVGNTGGYFAPIAFPYSLQGIKQDLGYHPEGRGATYREDIQIRVASFPAVDPQDVLVSAENKRYLITAANETMFPGTTIGLIQDCEAHLVSSSDSIYSIDVPV